MKLLEFAQMMTKRNKSFVLYLHQQISVIFQKFAVFGRNCQNFSNKSQKYFVGFLQPQKTPFSRLRRRKAVLIGLSTKMVIGPIPWRVEQNNPLNIHSFSQYQQIFGHIHTKLYREITSWFSLCKTLIHFRNYRSSYYPNRYV